MASPSDNSKPPTTYVQKFLLPKRNKTMSESSESSETGTMTDGSLTDLATNSRLTNSVSKPEVTAARSMPADGKEHYLYDKYLAK
jgi:hypothetical protein